MTGDALSGADGNAGRQHLSALPEADELSALELHSGLIMGTVSEAPPLPERGGPSPRSCLETIVAEHVSRGPCAVQFSGGRDSSLVLAVAVQVARREGLAPPSAITFRYAGVGSADESQWQDRICAHLGVTLEIVSVAPGADEVAGPLGVSRLLRDGPVSPVVVGIDLARVARAAAGRTVLTGHGGDEVLGPGRVSPYVWHWRRRRRPTRAWLAELAREAMPHRVRRQRIRRHQDEVGMIDWLHPDPRDVVLNALADNAASTSWDWRADRWQLPHQRLIDLTFRVMAGVAARERLELHHPLVDQRFLRSVCATNDRWGWATRTEAMHAIGGDLLPGDVLSRSTKAYFNHVYAGDRVRAFARSWNGSGVDQTLVDVERLRAAWTSAEIPAHALEPLQLALLAALADGWAPESSADDL